MGKVVITWTSFDSPLGMCHIAQSERGICLVKLGCSRAKFLRTLRKRTISLVEDISGSLAPARDQLLAYFNGGLRSFDLVLDLSEGTKFQLAAWKALQQIPYGETRSYAWVAKATGRPGAVRAVGQANARNPVPVIVPCHRVIRSDGTIGGYSAGLALKRKLLALEGIYLVES